jgi:outer membrane protein assembly factor BamE (lipoprotein component of BamABCDE complex)
MKASRFITAMAVALLSGCAQFHPVGIVSGTSTAAEVQSRMGEPAEKASLGNGDSVWYYAGGRIARQTYAVQFGANGVVQAVDQRLTEENVNRIIAEKTTMKEVRELMGPPHHVTYFELSKFTSWEYPMIPGSPSDWRILWVNFSDDGVVRQVLYMRDPEADYINPEGDWP